LKYLTQTFYTYLKRPELDQIAAWAVDERIAPAAAMAMKSNETHKTLRKHNF
jgi:hypothetical protein